MDETYDMIRCVRDKRFKYIRNFNPEKPYAQRIAYMDLMPTMQEWRRLAAEGKLEGPQKLFFQDTKPVHELYDTQADPHEINNLAYEPKYMEVRDRMSKALEHWMEEIGDLGFVQEDELIERFWPGGVQPVTLNPVIVPNGGRFKGAVNVRIACPTHGASIAWTTEDGENLAWKIYTGAIRLTENSNLRTKAIRIGYKESKEVSAYFEIF